MNDYETLRQRWTRELGRAGELDGFSDSERKLLEAGSLAVLATLRIARLERRRRAVRRLTSATPGLLALLLLVLLPSAGGARSVDSVWWLALAALVLALCASALSELWTRRATERADARCDLYERMRESTDRLVYEFV